jgi:hypothetical protein
MRLGVKECAAMAKLEVGQTVSIRDGSETVSIQPKDTKRFGVWSEERQDWLFIGPLKACEAFIGLDGHLPGGEEE